MNIGYDAKRLFHNSSGLGNYSRLLLESLANYYPDNSYFLYNPKPKTIDRFLSSSGTTEVLPREWVYRKIPSLWRQFFIAKQINKVNLDIYHGLSGELPFGIKNTRVRTVTTIHDLIFLRHPQWYKYIDRKVYLQKVKYAVTHSDVIVAISEQTKRDIISFLKIPKNRISVIYQGCNDVFKKAATIEQRTEVLKKYNLPSSYILNVGTVEHRKNALSILQAIKNIDIPLVIVGNTTPYIDKLKAYILNNKLSKRVFFVQKLSVQDLAVVYQSAKIFLYPSLFEGFGIPIIEAMYSRVPVITSYGSCFQEVGGGAHCVYVTPNDIETLSKEISTLLSDKKSSQDQVIKNYTHVQKFNNQNISKKYVELYQRLLEQ